MAIGKGLNAFLAAYYKAKESASKEIYQEIQLAYLRNKLGGKGVTGEDAQAQAVRDAAKGAYDRGNVGGLTEGRSAAPGHPIGDPVSTDMAPHQRAFLNAVAAPESNGEYDRMYAGMDRNTPPTYFEGYDAHPDIAAAGPAGPSTAAGRYMFTKSTWDRLGGGSFDPANQDKRAWELAKQDYASRTGGRDLDTELRTNGFTPQIASTLSPTWQGFKANPSLAADTYYSSLNRYNQPQVAEGQLTEGRSASALPPFQTTGVATPALAAAAVPPARIDNLGQALPLEAGVTAPTPTAYAPETYTQGIPVDYAAYDPRFTEAVYAAKGGLVPDLRQRWMQHFQSGGNVNGENDFYQQLGLPANFREQVSPFISAFTGGNGQLGLPANFREQAAPFISALRNAAPVNASPAPVNALPVPSNSAIGQAAPQAAPVVPRFNRPNFQNIRQRFNPQGSSGGMGNPLGNGFGGGNFGSGNSGGNWGALNLGQGYNNVQHFQGGGEVEPYPLIPVGAAAEGPPQFTYVNPNSPALGGSPEPPPDAPPQFTYVRTNAPWMGQPMVNNPYGDLVGPQGSPVGPQDFASATFSNSPYGRLDVPPIGPGDFAPETTTPMYNPYGALPLTPTSWDTPMPPPRPAGLGVAPAGGGGARSVPLPPRRPDDFQATTDAGSDQGAQDQGWNGQISPDNPIAQLLTGVEHAVSGGVRWLTKTLGFNNDAIPTSTSGLQALRNGDHALTEEEHDAVVKKVDPDNRLSPGIRNMVGMNAMYEYYLTNGSLDKAQKMAAGMLLYSEQYLRKSALSALSDPDPKSAAKKLADGFNQVPNNQHMTVDDNGNFVFRNETTGKVINAGRYNPQQLLAAATGAANGTVFWQSLNQFAHKDDEVDDKQTAAQKNAQATQAAINNFQKTLGTPAAPTEGIPVGGRGFQANAAADDTVDNDKDTEGANDDDSTEGRSGSATPAGAGPAQGSAVPKPNANATAYGAYVGQTPIYEDTLTPTQKAAFDAIPDERWKASQRVLHANRVKFAGEQAAAAARANQPDAPIKRTQLSSKDTEDQVNTAYTDHIEELKDKKDENGKPMPVPPPAAARAFKGIAREVVKANADSGGADAIDKTASLVEFNPSNGVPYKVDKDRNGWFAKMNDTGDEIRLTPSGKVQLQRVVNAKIAAASAAKQAAEAEAAKPSRVDAATGKIAEGYRGLPPATPQQVIAERAVRRYPQVAPAPVVPAVPAIPPRDWGWPSVR